MKTFTVQSIYNWYREAMRHPQWRWLVIGGSLLYLVSPIDISPDIFPVIGWLDDGVIAGLLVAELSQIMMQRLKTGKTTTETPPASPTTATTTATTTETVDVKASVTE
jgi:uncharacterized membrane protein YkvA (DUF1232 family)